MVKRLSRLDITVQTTLAELPTATAIYRRRTAELFNVSEDRLQISVSLDESAPSWLGADAPSWAGADASNWAGADAPSWAGADAPSWPASAGNRRRAATAGPSFNASDGRRVLTARLSALDTVGVEAASELDFPAQRAGEFFNLTVLSFDSIGSGLCVINALPPPEPPLVPPQPPAAPPTPPAIPPFPPGATVTTGIANGGVRCSELSACTEIGCTRDIDGACQEAPLGMCADGGRLSNCSRSTYGDARGLSCSACTACPQNTVSDAGSRFQSDCVCAQAFYAPKSNGVLGRDVTCMPCPLGATCPKGSTLETLHVRL